MRAGTSGQRESGYDRITVEQRFINHSITYGTRGERIEWSSPNFDRSGVALPSDSADYAKLTLLLHPPLKASRAVDREFR